MIFCANFFLIIYSYSSHLYTTEQDIVCAWDDLCLPFYVVSFSSSFKVQINCLLFCEGFKLRFTLLSTFHSEFFIVLWNLILILLWCISFLLLLPEWSLMTAGVLSVLFIVISPGPRKFLAQKSWINMLWVIHLLVNIDI